MRVAIRSASAAVTRTLEALVQEAGHEAVIDADAPAELCVIDSLHPSAAAMPKAAARLVLASAPSGKEATTTLPCPLSVQALRQWLRRQQPKQAPQVLASGWLHDPIARQLRHPTASDLSLTEKESALLAVLAEPGASSYTRDYLLQNVWGMDAGLDTHTLETHIYRLRSKLEQVQPSPGHIHTEAGSYRLVTQA
jgi:hypothetical protein